MQGFGRISDGVYRVILVPRDATRLAEQLGSRDKYWYDTDDSRLLFKLGRPNTGEHWAEVVTARIADHLHIPHATYDLATDGRIGVVTPSLVRENNARRLIHGNEVLARTFALYPKNLGKPGTSYNLVAIREAVASVVSESPVRAISTFGTYLLLDALVANQDRHHENWGILETASGTMRLAPTYDHAASLACRLSDEERGLRMITRDRGFSVELFASRARTWFYRDPSASRRLSTIDAATAWLPWVERDVLESFLEQLKSFDGARLDRVFNDLEGAGISEVAIEFAVRLLRVNRQRLFAALMAVLH